MPPARSPLTELRLALHSLPSCFRLTDKVTHQMIVMGLDPRVRWLAEMALWVGIMYALWLCVLVAMMVYPDTIPKPEAFPVLLIIGLACLPSFFLFCALLNFVFWCRDDVDDVTTITRDRLHD